MAKINWMRKSIGCTKMYRLLFTVVLIGFAALLDMAAALCSMEEAKTTDYPYRYFATKTLYEVSGGNISTFSPRGPDYCKPIHIFMIVRHGSRNPGADSNVFLNRLLEMAKKVNSTGNAQLCTKDLEEIRRWTNWYDPQLKKDLAPTGYSEMEGLAKRFAEKFPEILADADNHTDRYRFFTTITRRTNQSMHAFANALFKTQRARDRASYETREWLLHFYKYCEKYLMQVDDNDTALADVDKFLNGLHVSKVAENLALRMGIPRENITNKLVEDIWKEGCANEQWVTGRNGAWCLPFTAHDFKVMEYTKDMKDYLTKSYGHEISYKNSCHLVNYIMKALENASKANETERIRGHFAFGHSKTIMTTATNMGLIKNGGLLTSDNFAMEVNRTFRSSFYEPGGANIAIVLYRCTEQPDYHRIQIFLNEFPVGSPKYPLMHPDSLWSLDDALEYYSYCNAENYNVTEECKLDSSTTAQPEEHTNVGIRAINNYTTLILLLFVAISFTLALDEQ